MDHDVLTCPRRHALTVAQFNAGEVPHVRTGERLADHPVEVGVPATTVSEWRAPRLQPPAFTALVIAGLLRLPVEASAWPRSSVPSPGMTTTTLT